MRPAPPARRHVRVQISEVEGSKMVPGSGHNISVWEATTEEVLAVIQQALDAAAGGAGLPRSRAEVDNQWFDPDVYPQRKS